MWPRGGGGRRDPRSLRRPARPDPVHRHFGFPVWCLAERRRDRAIEGRRDRAFPIEAGIYRNRLREVEDEDAHSQRQYLQNKEIAEFCRLTYGVEFPMFEKSSVTSIRTNPLYAELLARTGQSPKWNFHKYLVDRDGKKVTSFGTRVEPDNGDLVSTVERMLAAKPAPPKS